MQMAQLLLNIVCYLIRLYLQTEKKLAKLLIDDMPNYIRA